MEKELIYLPTYPRYSRREVEKNIQVIRQYFRERVQQVTKQTVGIVN